MRRFFVAILLSFLVACSGSKDEQNSTNTPDQRVPQKSPEKENKSDVTVRPESSADTKEAAPSPSKDTPPKEPTVRPPKKVPPTPRVLVVPKATSTRLSLVEGVMAKKIVEREPVEIASRFSSDVGQVNAFVRIKNDGPPTKAVMIWRHGDQEQFRIDLKIGTSPTWRTWSRMTMSERKKGAWVVELLDEQGASLGGIPFQID